MVKYDVPLQKTTKQGPIFLTQDASQDAKPERNPLVVIALVFRVWGLGFKHWSLGFRVRVLPSVVTPKEP